MTARDLLDMLIVTLMRTVGGTRREWRIVLGKVRVYDRATHPHCNWAIEPSGDFRQNAQVERVLDDLRGRHPLIDAV